MANTDYLQLALTGADENSITFKEWRQLINGTSASNMIKIDSAVQTLNTSLGGKADGLTFDSTANTVTLTSGGTAISGAVIDLDALLTSAKIASALGYTPADLSSKIEVFDDVEVTEDGTASVKRWQNFKLVIAMYDATACYSIPTNGFQIRFIGRNESGDTYVNSRSFTAKFGVAMCFIVNGFPVFLAADSATTGGQLSNMTMQTALGVWKSADVLKPNRVYYYDILSNSGNFPIGMKIKTFGITL